MSVKKNESPDVGLLILYFIAFGAMLLAFHVWMGGPRIPAIRDLANNIALVGVVAGVASLIFGFWKDPSR